MHTFWKQMPTRMILAVYSLIVVYPLFWLVMTSFKSTAEFYANPFELPKEWAIDNYVNAFERAHLGTYFLNSLIVAVSAVLISHMVSILAAYVLARFRFPLAGSIKRLYAFALFIPSIVSIPPTFQLLNGMYLLDTRIGLILIYAAISLPFTILLIRVYLVMIPNECEESAMMDGCSFLGTLFRIISPMAAPGLVTVTIFNFLGFWNEYIYAVSLISTEAKRTMTLGLAYLYEVQRYATDWGTLFAGLVIVMLPTLLVYLVFQRKITDGLALNGIKRG